MRDSCFQRTRCLLFSGFFKCVISRAWPETRHQAPPARAADLADEDTAGAGADHVTARSLRGSTGTRCPSSLPQSPTSDVAVDWTNCQPHRIVGNCGLLSCSLGSRCVGMTDHVTKEACRDWSVLMGGTLGCQACPMEGQTLGFHGLRWHRNWRRGGRNVTNEKLKDANTQ